VVVGGYYPQQQHPNIIKKTISEHHGAMMRKISSESMSAIDQNPDDGISKEM